MQIRNRSLNDQVRDVLLGWLAEGRLGPGQRLQEVSLTERLGVSRTPLREALRGLEQEGLVVSIPNRGFRIPDLDVRVVRELYPIIGSLESLALRLAGVPTPDRIEELRELNKAMSLPDLSTRQRYSLDSRWHDLIIGHNPNRTLAAELERLKRRVMFYDVAWDRHSAAIENACRHHAEITDLLAIGKVKDAAAALEHHRVSGAEVIAAWLRERNSPT